MVKDTIRLKELYPEPLSSFTHLRLTHGQLVFLVSYGLAGGKRGMNAGVVLLLACSFMTTGHRLIIYTLNPL